MNSDSRWSCRAVRRIAALHDDHGTPTDLWGRRHLARCAACQAYFAATQSLDLELRAAARQTFEPGPASLDRKIMRAIAESEIEPAPRPARRLAAYALAGAAAALVAVVTIQPVRNLFPAQPVHPERPTGEATASADTTAIALLSDSPWTALRQPVSDALEADPLKTEAESVYADARYAVRVLAANFVPSSEANGHDSFSTRKPAG